MGLKVPGVGAQVDVCKKSAGGMESVEDVSPGHIAEEEERHLQEAAVQASRASRLIISDFRCLGKSREGLSFRFLSLKALRLKRVGPQRWPKRAGTANPAPLMEGGAAKLELMFKVAGAASTNMAAWHKKKILWLPWMARSPQPY